MLPSKRFCQLTLYCPKLVTEQVSTASRPTGAVTLSIGLLKSGLKSVVILAGEALGFPNIPSVTKHVLLESASYSTCCGKQDTSNGTIIASARLNFVTVRKMGLKQLRSAVSKSLY